MEATNGLLGMVVAALGILLLLRMCASETKENVNRALAKEQTNLEPSTTYKN